MKDLHSRTKDSLAKIKYQLSLRVKLESFPYELKHQKGLQALCVCVCVMSIIKNFHNGQSGAFHQLLAWVNIPEKS